MESACFDLDETNKIYPSIFRPNPEKPVIVTTHNVIKIVLNEPAKSSFRVILLKGPIARIVNFKAGKSEAAFYIDKSLHKQELIVRIEICNDIPVKGSFELLQVPRGQTLPEEGFDY